jgi:hypothetical protein
MVEFLLNVAKQIPRPPRLGKLGSPARNDKVEDVSPALKHRAIVATPLRGWVDIGLQWAGWLGLSRSGVRPLGREKQVPRPGSPRQARLAGSE